MRIFILFSFLISLFISQAMAEEKDNVLPELSKQAFVGTQSFDPLNDQEWVNQCLNLGLDKKFGCKIIAYKIQWFDGNWSSWFVPGVNDLYKKEGESLSRYWACFNDHSFEIIYTSDSKINFPEAHDNKATNKSHASDKESETKLNMKLDSPVPELKLEGVILSGPKGNMPHSYDLKKRVSSDSTVGEVVTLLGPGYVSPDSGTGSINWFFSDGSILSTSGWPSSLTQKVRLTETSKEQENIYSDGNKHLSLQNQFGFDSLFYLFNREKWSELPKTGIRILNGEMNIGLNNPKQVIMLQNAWNLPGIGEDIRLKDMKENVFLNSAFFNNEWPDYRNPGYVALVQKQEGSWVLVAELGDYFLIEDKGCIGLKKRSSK